MTAEIAVMNKSGIAMAADSKVSIGGPSPSKGYDTVNKLFSLSKSHPVGIMVYGNAELMGIPWETLIKDYRKSIGSKSFATIDDWRDNFVEYLSEGFFFDEESIIDNTRNIIQSQLHFVMTELDVLHNYLDDTIENQKILLLEYLDEKISELKSQKLSKTGKLSPLSKKIVEAESDDIDIEDEDIAQKIRTVLELTLLAKTQSNLESGIVIAGFGDKQVFPCLADFSTDGIVNGALRIAVAESVPINHNRTSCIKSFAQHDMVQRFMLGADSNFLQTISMALHDILLESNKSTLKKYGLKSLKNENSEKEIQDVVEKISQGFCRKYYRFCKY